MRILHVVNYISDRGNGIANVVIDLAVAQVLEGHAVAIASSGGEYREILGRHGIIDVQIPALRAGTIVKSVRAFDRELGEFRPDIIHSHTRAALVLAWLCGRRVGIPVIAHLHNVHDSALWLFRLADRVIAVSVAVKIYASRFVDASTISVVLNGTIGSARVPAVKGIIPCVLQHPAIVTVAGMNRRKGIADLLCAFELVASKHTDAHLYLVGEGPERQAFEKQAAESQYWSRIHFEGYQSTPQAYMLAADVFVLASRRDSLGLVILEAREAGSAIVATDVDGIPEALSGGQGGILVSPSSPSKLADAVCLLLTDDATRRMWQRRAREGLQEFTCEHMGGQVLEIYKAVLSSFAVSSR